MPETATPVRDLESWKNDTAGVVGLRRLDHRGELSRTEMIEGGKVFHISPEERRINSEQAATEDLDFFRNGVLTPVRLLDDSEEARELASNPNIMSESDMADLVKAHPKTFAKKVSEIRNPGTLERLLAVAHNEDATIGKVEAIKERLAQVAPSLARDDSTAPTAAGPAAAGSSAVRGVTPR